MVSSLPGAVSRGQTSTASGSRVCSGGSVDPRDPQCSIQDLLAGQLALVEQTLAFNEAIACRLSLVEEGVQPAGAVVTTHAAPQRRASLASERTNGSESDSLLPAVAGVSQQRRILRQKSQLLRGPLLPNVDDMKKKMLEELKDPEYHEDDNYDKEGVFQWMAKHRYFTNSTLVLIALNAVWIGYETDHNKELVPSNAPIGFQVVNNLFCFFFAFELAVRFFAFRNKKDVFKNLWWIFDAFLVALMVWETWIQAIMYKTMNYVSGQGQKHSIIFRAIRVVRLTRVFRMARLMRHMPELMILVKAMAMATRAVAAVFLLLIFIVYVFAIVFTQLLSGTQGGPGCFETVPEAAICLLHLGVIPDQADLAGKLLEVDWTYYGIMLLYIVIASLTCLNMLIGVICEVVSVVSQGEKEGLSIKSMEHRLRDIMTRFDLPGADVADVVSVEKFFWLMQQPATQHILHDHNIDVVALIDHWDFIFRNKEEMPLGEFLTIMLQFRGVNAATVKDIVDMRQFVSTALSALDGRMAKVEARSNTPRRSLSEGSVG